MPKILHSKTLYQDKFFTIKSDEIKLENRATWVFEYVDSFDDNKWAVMVVPVDNDENYYLVQMFQIGTWEETITFPKWWSKEWYTAIQSAQEELQEEIGIKADSLTQIGTLYSHPGRAKRKHNIILAQGLTQSQLKWDEIETITILKLSQDEVKNKIMSWEICDAKTIASFYMAIQFLQDIEISKIL